MPVLPFGGLDPAAALDHRFPDETPLPPVDDDADEDEPLTRHGAALLDQVLGHPTTRLVNHHVLVGNPPGVHEAIIGQRHAVSVGAPQDPVWCHTAPQRQVVVGDQVRVLAVHRYEQLRIGRVVQRQQLIGLAVPGRVDPQLAAVHKLHATPRQGIVQTRDGCLVARNRMR